MTCPKSLSKTRLRSRSRIFLGLEATIASTILAKRKGRWQKQGEGPGVPVPPRSLAGVGAKEFSSVPLDWALLMTYWLLLHFSESPSSCPSFLSHFPLAQRVHVVSWDPRSSMPSFDSELPSPLCSGREVLGQGFLTLLTPWIPLATWWSLQIPSQNVLICIK